MEALRELAVLLGYKTDQKSFEAAILKADAVKWALRAVVDTAKQMAQAMVDTVVEVAKAGADLQDMAKRTGVAADVLQSFGYAADLNGASLESVGLAMKGLANNMQAAQAGTGAQAEAFNKLGIKTKGADGKLRPLNAVMLDIADRFKAMPDGAEKSALAMDVLSKAGGELIPMLNLGGAELQRLTDKARAFGVIMDQDMLEATDAFDDALVDVSYAMKGLKMAIVGPLLKPLAGLLESFAKWVALHREAIATGIVGFLKNVGKVLGVIWHMARPFIWVLEKLVENSTALTIVVGLLVTALGVGLLFVMGALIVKAFLMATAFFTAAAGVWATLAPIIGIAAAVLALLAVFALLAEDVYAFATGGKSLLGVFVNALKTMGKAIGGALVEWFTTAIDFWKQQFTAFIGWLGEKWSALPGPVQTALKFAGVGAAGAAFGPVGALAAGGLSLMGGGAESPAAAGAGESGPNMSVQAPRFTATFNIKSTDPAEAGTESQSKMDEWFREKISSSASAVRGG